MLVTVAGKPQSSPRHSVLHDTKTRWYVERRPSGYGNMDGIDAHFYICCYFKLLIINLSSVCSSESIVNRLRAEWQNVRFTVWHNYFFPPPLTSNAKKGCCIISIREIFLEGWSGRSEKLVTACNAEIRTCRNVTRRTFSVSCRSTFMTRVLIIDWKNLLSATINKHL